MDVLLSLISGLAIAIMVQLLLTNLGIALGLSVLDWSPSDIAEPVTDSASDEAAAGKSLPVTHLVGVGVALTLSTVLFVAALLATEFSQIAEPRRGIIFGIILWSVYWLLFIWLSSTTLSNLANSVLGTAIAGGRRLFTTLRQVWRSPPLDAAADLEPTALRELAAELSQMRELREQLPTLLAQQRETLIQDISERTDLSPQQAESVVEEIDPAPAAASAAGRSSPSAANLLSQLDLPNWQQVVQQVLDQVDLSDWDAETLWHQAQSLLDSEPGEEATAATAATVEVSASAVVQDAEDYVRHSPTWALQPDVIQQEFYQRLYDPEAAPAAIQEQVTQLSPADYVDWLRARGDMAADQVEAIADRLTQVQESVMTTVAAASAHSDEATAVTAPTPHWPEMADKLLAYLRYTNLDLLTPDNLTEKIQAVQTEIGLEAPMRTVTQAQLTPLTAVLARRQGLEPDQQQALEAVLYTSLTTDESVAAGDRLEQLTQLVQDTLGRVDWSAVSLEDLKPELKHQLRSLDLRGEIDWQALQARLQLPEETKTALVDWLQDVGQDLSRAPRRWAHRVGDSTQAWAEQLTHELSQYLQFQDKSAFQPQQMAQDIVHLLQGGLRRLPSPADWPDLADLRDLLDLEAVRTALENRRDLTIEEIQQVMGWLEAGWQQGLQQVESWTTALWQLARDRVTNQAENLDTIREQVVERIAAAQTAVQASAADLQADVQRQADAARRQVAIAAWWLFLSLLSSGSAAAIAGWLAVQY